MSGTTEQAVIGWVMLFSPDALSQALQVGCEAGWFTEPKNQLTWEIIMDLNDLNLSPHPYLVGGEIAKRGETQRLSLADLGEFMAAAVPTSMSFGEALRVLGAAHSAKLRGGLWSAGRLAGDGHDPEKERETAKRISDTFKSYNPPQTFQSAAAELAASLDSGKLPDYGIPTGLIDIDRGMGSLQPGELIVVAARPGCGKSSILRQISCGVALEGRRIVLVSTEMGASEIVLAAARQSSNVPYSRETALPAPLMLKFKETVRKLSVMSNFKLIEERSLYSLIARWRSMIAEEYPPSLFVVDYLQQLDAGMRKGETLAAAVGRISSELKAFAKEFRVIVLAAAQLNRESAKEGEPQLYHLRDSGAIEQDADRVIMLKLADNDIPEQRLAVVEVFQRKNRNGPLGYCKLTFDRWTTRFTNYSA